MKPTSPVIPKYAHEEVIFAKDQPEYMPLPVLRIGEPRDGVLLTRWTMNWRERLRVLFTGSVFLQVMTFNGPLQPLVLTVEPPSEAITEEGVALTEGVRS